MKPLISILIPCFNGANFIKTSIDSCLKQTYENLEIIFVNDGSTDNSLEIINEYAKQHPQIKVFSQENLGLGETRNRLINYAQGEYFFFLDVDDVIPDSAISNLYEASNDGQNNLIVGRSMCLINDRFKIPFLPTWWLVKDMDPGHYLKSNICTPWGGLVKTSYFRSLNVKFLKGEIFEDVGIMPYVYIKAGNKFNYVKKIVYNYRIKNRVNNLSSFKNRFQPKIYSLYQQTEQILSLLEKEGFNIEKKYRRYVNGLNYPILMLIAFLSNNYGTPRRAFWNEFQLAPRFNILNILNSYGYSTIKFSKTIWKSFSFFLIKHWYKKIIKSIKSKNENDLTIFLNKQIIRDPYKYFLTKNLQPKKKRKNAIIEINLDNVESFIEKHQNVKTIRCKLLIRVKNEYELNFFIKKYYNFFAKHPIVLGLELNHLYDWNLVLKYFAFTFSNDIDILEYIHEQTLKTVVMSHEIDDPKLVNYVVH